MVKYRSKLDRAKIKANQLKSRLKTEFFTLDNFILILTPLLLVAWFVGTISSLNRNWELQQQINTRRLDLQRLELEIESLSLENQYYASDEYQELAARRLQNKKLPGETMIYLSKNSDFAKNKYANTADSTPTITSSNLEQWLSYLFGA